MIVGDPLAAEISRCDLAIVDMDQGPMPVDAVRAALDDLRPAGVEALVRVSSLPNALQAACACAPAGIIVPLVSSAADAQAAVRAAGPGISVIAQIETVAAIDNLDAIAAVDGIDGLFVSPYDLAMDLGFDYTGAWPTQPGPFADALARVPETARRYGKLAGLQASSNDVATACIARGYQLICLATDELMKWRARYRAGLRFDATFGVKTEIWLYPEQIDRESYGANLPFAKHYQPLPVCEIDRALDALPLASATTTFVDVGAGLGRAVLRAAGRPFRRVIGVEISAELVAGAERNLQDFRGELRCADVSFVRCDAAEYAFPPGDLAVFLFNPFGPEVLRPFVDRLAEPAGRDVVILYWGAFERAVLDAHPAFVLEAGFEMGLVYRLRTKGGVP